MSPWNETVRATIAYTNGHPSYMPPPSPTCVLFLDGVARPALDGPVPHAVAHYHRDTLSRVSFKDVRGDVSKAIRLKSMRVAVVVMRLLERPLHEFIEVKMTRAFRADVVNKA